MSCSLNRSCLVVIVLLGLHSVARSQLLIDSLAIEVRDGSREFSYTNKESAFYYGETNTENSSSWQGFNVSGFEFLDDYVLYVNGEQLHRSSATKTIVYPDYLQRIYPNGIVEQLRPVDSLALFGIIVTSAKPIELAIVPFFTDSRDTGAYESRLRTETALVARRNHLYRTPQHNLPVWMAIHAKGFVPRHEQKRRGNQFSPISLYGNRSKTHIISFSVAETESQAHNLAARYAGDASRLFDQRRQRMQLLLTQTAVETEDKRFDKALAWAKLSLDALIMNQGTKGIFAGLPWFNSYWGRDTFISLPGATLVTGHFAEAKKILASFAEFQERDSTSINYGRIPNIVTTTGMRYNTADGTPRFVMMVKEYVERSGDTAFGYHMYPVIARSIDGTLKYHCDTLSFLTHGDAETWMDAVGPGGPWSPRGNRANDIQALWSQQLETGIWFATRIGDTESAKRWNSVLQNLKAHFKTHFIVHGMVVDHINRDGSPDEQLRPNQIFTSPMLDEAMRARVLSSVTSALTYEHGVASLSQDDEDFHPYHLYSPFYPKDAAYHNGVVWTWLQGPVISELCRVGKEELGYRITQNSVSQILDRGAVGTQSELLDAAPRPGEVEPRLSGTFSQAWNLAEFIRNFYDDYLGIRVNLLEHTLNLRPKIPKSVGKVKGTINLNGRALPIEVDQHAPVPSVVIDGTNLRRGGTAMIQLDSRSGKSVTTRFHLPARSVVRFELKDTSVTLWCNGDKHEYSIAIDTPLPTDFLEHIELATPSVRPDLRSIRGPDHSRIPHMKVKAINPDADILVAATDPSGDDTGTGAFVYPTNPNYVPGILDITGFIVRYDESQAYFTLEFRSLTDPGWHPEYGFQLTYVAIAVDTDAIPGSGKRLVEHNANYLLGEQNAYEKLILIGGGVRVEDERGRILAEYFPSESDVSNPLGSVESRTISFAISLEYLGKPLPAWTFTILVGGQDDHGGAGLGEFRTVNTEPTEWVGGGNTYPPHPNVYDVLVVSGR